MKVSLFAPARNEQNNIKLFIEKIQNTFNKHKITGEIIIVDDASTDNTGLILDNLKKRYSNLVIIHNKRKQGITGSMTTAFKYAKNDIFMFFCSDLESNPEEDIPKILEPIEKEDYDMVVGWRYNKKAGIIKILLSKIFNSLSNIFFGVKLHDLGWVKAFKRDIINEIEPLRSDWHRFIAVFAYNAGYKVKEIKTTWYPRHSGKSNFGKFGFGRLLGGFLDLLVIKFYLSFSKKPMLLFGISGFSFLTLGFLTGLFLLYRWMHGLVLGNTLILVVLLAIIGIQLIALGFISEFLASIREDIKRK